MKLEGRARRLTVFISEEDRVEVINYVGRPAQA